MNRSRIALLLAAVLAVLPSAASALTHNINLHRPEEIAKLGISATIQTIRSGALKCSVRFDKAKIGARLASVELSSRTGKDVLEMELRPRERGDDLVCHFTLSREFLMHGQLSLGLTDDFPGGIFYQIAFVDFVDFGDDLPPPLRERLARLVALGLVDFGQHNQVDGLAEQIARYERSIPMRAGDEKGTQAELIGKLSGPFPKTPIHPFQDGANK